MEDINAKKLFPKSSVDSNISLQVVHDYSTWYCSIRLTVLDEMISAQFLWGNEFISGGAINRCKEFKFWNVWEHPLFEILEYAFNIQVKTMFLKAGLENVSLTDAIINKKINVL